MIENTYIYIYIYIYLNANISEGGNKTYHLSSNNTPVDLDPLEKEVDLNINYHVHFNDLGHFVHFDDLDCNVTVFANINIFDIVFKSTWPWNINVGSRLNIVPN